MDESTNTMSPGQIRQQLRQVIFRHLQRELRNNFKDTPESCKFNQFTAINGSSERIGVCRFDKSAADGVQSPRGKVCDSRVAGCLLQARTCKCFCSVRTKDEVKSEFQTFMASDRGTIAARYPDVAALMWVLHGGDFTDEIRMAVDEVGPPEKVST